LIEAVYRRFGSEKVGSDIDSKDGVPVVRGGSGEAGPLADTDVEYEPIEASERISRVGNASGAVLGSETSPTRTEA
jgi:hypothetical protein